MNLTPPIIVEYKSHTFAPSHTLHAVLKFYNSHSLSSEELESLLKLFLEENNRLNEVIKVGETLKIPVMSR